MTKIIVFALAMLCACLNYAQHTHKLEKLYYQGDYSGVTNFLVDDDLLSPEDHFIIANAFQKLEDFDNALYYYDMASPLKNELKDYYLNRAICEISVGEVDAAERNLFIYEEQNGIHPMVYYYLGVIDYELLEYKSSAKILDKALELNPEYMEAWFLKGAVFAEQEDFHGALSCFEKCLSLSPNHEQSALYLAVSLMNVKDYKKAYELLDQLITDEGETLGEALYYRAEINYTLHNPEKACEDWRLAAANGDEFAAKNIKMICEKGKTNKHRTKKISRITL